MALNKYIDRTESLIKKYRDITLDQFQNTEGKPAIFEDLIWFFIHPEFGTKTRILTGRHGTKGSGRSGLDSKNSLPHPYGDLIKVFIIEIFSTPVSLGEKVARIANSRKLISKMEGHLYQQNCTSIIAHFNSTQVRRIIPFIVFCESHGLIPKFSNQLRRKSIDKRDRTGHEQYWQQTEKIPNEEVIKVIGAIYFKILSCLSSGRHKPGYIRDAFASFTALLCLAAPNRAAAEVPLLSNQELKSYSESECPAIYFLDWPGSKGYKANRNHILSSLASHVQKGLNYFSNAFRPGRIIARYYINPNQTLRSLLGDISIEPDREKYLDLDKKPHIFQLGYSLGFYGVDDKVRIYVNPDSTKAPNHNRSGWQLKRISELAPHDMLSSSPADNTRYGVYKLLNFYLKPIKPTENGLISVEDIEKQLFEFHKKRNPSFPLGFSTGETSNVRMDSALFCVLGHQYYEKHRYGTLGGRGYYTIFKPKQLAINAAHDVGKKGCFFERHGFSPSLFLNFHQLRHYTNTLADRSGIPNEIITAWSGRKNREQTNEYIHTTHEERATRVKDVQIKEHDSSHPIRWIARDEIGQKLNLPASASSTGVCTQNLVSNPCDFLNDFVSSCLLCPSACHIAGDNEAIDILKRDHHFQSERLKTVESDSRLAVSNVMKDWFIVHTRNTAILSQLIQLMRDMPAGTIISFNKSALRFNLLDLPTKKIEHFAVKLPNTEAALQQVLELYENNDEKPRKSNIELENLLASFNLGENR